MVTKEQSIDFRNEANDKYVHMFNIDKHVWANKIKYVLYKNLVRGSEKNNTRPEC